LRRQNKLRAPESSSGAFFVVRKTERKHNKSIEKKKEKGKKIMKNRQKKWKSLGIVVLVFVIGYGLLWYYMAANVTRIQEQNKEYAKSFAAQSAERIGSEFNTALQRIENSAYLASMGDSSALIDVDTLKELENHTNFDAVRYVDRDGNNLSSDGQVCQIQDRSYFKKGCLGQVA